MRRRREVGISLSFIRIVVFGGRFDSAVMSFETRERRVKREILVRTFDVRRVV